jgi:class 3 adenylate cyclase
VSLIDETPLALKWVEETTATLRSGRFGRIISGVVWTDAPNPDFNLADHDPDLMARKAEDLEILRNHDPGLLAGRVLAAKAFKSPNGRRFVAGVFGMYTRERQVRFAAIGLSAKVPVVLPTALPEPLDGWRLDLQCDPREVSHEWVADVARHSPLPVSLNEASNNALDPVIELLCVGLPYASLVWTPAVTGLTMQGRAVYAGIHKWLRQLWSSLGDRRRSVICINSHQDGCDVRFLFRGSDGSRLQRAHDLLPRAAAQAAEIIADAKMRGLAPRRLIYECDGPASEWYASSFLLDDGTLISDGNGLVPVDELSTGLSLGLRLNESADDVAGGAETQPASQQREATMNAKPLSALRVDSDLQATVAFIQLSDLRRRPPDVMGAALQRLNKLATRVDAYVLNTATGVILVCPHEAGNQGALAAAMAMASDWDVEPALKIGVTSGKLSVVVDVDGHNNLVGVPINTAARIANALTESGVAVHETFTNWADATTTEGHWLHEHRRTKVELRGKKHDAPYVCYVQTDLGCPQPTKRHFDIAASPAVLIAYDLAGFSKGDLATLRARFKSLAQVITKVGLDGALGGDSVLLSPGGDGGIYVVAGSGVSFANAVALSRQLQEWAEAESRGVHARRAIQPRVGVHYGQVLRYENTYGIARPFGLDLFAADDLANDDDARRYSGVVMSKEIAEAVANDDLEYLNEMFDELPPVSGGRLKRYARKLDRIAAAETAANEDAKVSPT